MAKSRTQYSVINVYSGIGAQVIGLIVSYVIRYFFIQYLSIEYLGVNGLFSSVITLFSLAELGIGSAIVFAMYKPIAEKNTLLVQKYMQFYKVCYRVIAIVVLCAGLAILPNIGWFINGEASVEHLSVIYLLFLIDSVASYLFVYKISIFNAMQENYIVNIIQSVGKIISAIVMIAILAATKNFILFLAIQIIFKLLTNVVVSLTADKKYPYIINTHEHRLSKAERQSVFKNVYALFCSNIGIILANASTAIIMSKMVSLVTVAVYSNYVLIIGALSHLIGQAFNAIVASVGNLASEKGHNESFQLFEKVNFATFILSLFATTILYVTINDFIELSFGSGFLFSNDIVTVIVISFYMLAMKNAIGTFKYAMGVFWDDKYINIVRAILAIVISILLVSKIGVIGIFVGALASEVISSFWFQAKVLFNKGFHRSSVQYFAEYLLYSLAVGLSCAISTTLIHYVSNGSSLFVQLIVDVIIGSMTSFGVMMLFYRNKSFVHFKKMITEFHILKKIWPRHSA